MNLVELIRNAVNSGIAAPKIRTEKYKFSKSPNKASIWVTDHGKFGENVYYGKIDCNSGQFYLASGFAPSIFDEVQKIILNCEESLKDYGQKTGSCCICGRPLVNKTSVKYMIGPICAEKTGMAASYFAEYNASETEGQRQDLANSQPSSKQQKIKDIKQEQYSFEGL